MIVEVSASVVIQVGDDWSFEYSNNGETLVNPVITESLGDITLH